MQVNNAMEGKSYQIGISIVNDTAYVTRVQVGYSSSHYHDPLVNLSGVSMIGDTLLILNSDSYWYIPFADVDPISITHGGSWKYTCGCGHIEQQPMGCKPSKDNFDPDYSITHCIKDLEAECEHVCIGYLQKQSIVYLSGGIILRANILVI